MRDSCESEIGLTEINDLDGEPVVQGTYGKELILDCYGCDPSLFTRKHLRRFFKGFVALLDMERGTLHFWDDVGVPEEERQTRLETKGTSAVQFILTSNITAHCLDLLGRVYVNVFSCKDFRNGPAKQYVQDFFKAKTVRSHVVYRV